MQFAQNKSKRPKSRKHKISTFATKVAEGFITLVKAKENALCKFFFINFRHQTLFYYALAFVLIQCPVTFTRKVLINIWYFCKLIFDMILYCILKGHLHSLRCLFFVFVLSHIICSWKVFFFFLQKVLKMFPTIYYFLVSKY